MSKKSRVANRKQRVKSAYDRTSGEHPPIVEEQGFDSVVEGLRTPQQRAPHAFMLAALAVTMGSTPPTSFVVQGKVLLPGAEEHTLSAWVRLSGGWVWEPVSCEIYLENDFNAWRQVRDERAFGKKTATDLMAKTKHYGPWSPAHAPTPKPDPDEEDQP